MDFQSRTAAETSFFEGNRAMNMGDDTAALAAFAEAVRLSPGFAEAHANLALILDRQGRKKDAEAHYRLSIEQDPSYSETHLNLGVLLASQRRFNEAEAAYTRAIALRPAGAAGWSNLGVLYASMKLEFQAEQCQRTAIALDPSYAKASFNLAYLLLRQGRFQEGWTCLEARDWYGRLTQRLPMPRWQGEPLHGRSVLVVEQAGLGDAIQFCRYIPLLKRQGAGRVAFSCPASLHPLLSSLAGLDDLLTPEHTAMEGEWDCWTPLMSLPHHFDTRLETIPAQLPYLAAPPERLERWAALIHPGQGMSVGLVWRGNPRFENDAYRSLPALMSLAPLATVPGVRFFSLQKGAGEDEANHPLDGMNLTALGPKLADWGDTAAAITCLDMVITVDTAVAHLAGALGKPCWVLLSDYLPDWRWLTARSDSPWYPGALRLFRQYRAGDWLSVVAEVADALWEEGTRAVPRPPHFTLT